MPSGGLVGMGVAALLALAGALSPPAVTLAPHQQLYAFGYNGFGELGNPPTEEAEIGNGNPVPAPVNLPAGATGAISRIAAGALSPRAYDAVLRASDPAGRSQSATLAFVVLR